MQKQAPSLGRILTMVVFALSCFGLLLFLWLAFGGPTPLKPQGYRIQVSFPQAGQLAQEADVRISGVSVGKVTKLEANRNGTTEATVQIDSKFAPMAKDTRAILRQKTLLGETYVELTPGAPGGPDIPENGRLAAGQVAPTVQFDDLLSTFDPKTRAAFATWVQSTAVATAGRGRDLSNALGTLPPFVDNTDELVSLLNSQEGAVRRLVRNTGTVFDALSTRRGQLSGLITNANTVFATTAQRDQQLQEIFRALPTFEKESTTTLNALDDFAHNANPLVTQLQPVADQLTPTLEDLDALSPTLKALFTNVAPVITNAAEGLPAIQKFLPTITPLLGAVDQPLRQLIPVLYGLGFYKHELTAFFGNSAAATQAVQPPGGSDTGAPLHYLRTVNPLGPENLAGYPNRLGTTRASAYTYPEAFTLLKSGLLSYDTRSCGNSVPALGPGQPLPTHGFEQDLRAQIVQQAFLGNENGSAVVAPRCQIQNKFPNADGSLTTYPQITASTKPVARR